MAILNENSTIGNLNIVEAIKNKPIYGPVTTTGTGSAYIATIEDGPESLYTGLLLVIIPHTISTSIAPTLNVNSLGVKGLALYSDDSMSNIILPSKEDIYVAQKPLLLIYDGTYFRVLNFNEVAWRNIHGKPSSFTPSSHASNSTTYGAGTSTSYGHVRVKNDLTQTSSGQYVLDAYQGKVLSDKINSMSTTVTLPVLSTDPSSPKPGQMWLRS